MRFERKKALSLFSSTIYFNTVSELVRYLNVNLCRFHHSFSSHVPNVLDA